MSEKKTYINFPGISYISNGPLWADKITITALINDLPVPVYIYDDSSWSTVTQLTDALYHTRYATKQIPATKGFGRFKSFSEDLGQGRFRHYLYSSHEPSTSVESIVHRNLIDNGGLCTVEAGTSLNVNVEFIITLYADISYSQTLPENMINNPRDEVDVYNKAYSFDVVSTPEFVQIGTYKCVYNPLMPAEIGDVTLYKGTPTQLYLNYSESPNTSCRVDFTNSFIPSSKQIINDSETISVPIGPETGPSWDTSLSIHEGKKAPQKALITELPKINEWLKADAYKAVLMTAHNKNYKNWWNDSGQGSAIELFSGRRKGLQKCTLVAAHAKEWPFSYNHTNTISVLFTALQDLKTYLRDLGTATLSSDVSTGSGNKAITWSSSIYYPSGKTACMYSGFNWSDSIQSYLTSVHETAFFDPWQKEDGFNTDVIREKSFNAETVWFNTADPTIKVATLTPSSVKCNLNADLKTKYSVSSSVSYSTLKDVYYGTIYAPWSFSGKMSDFTGEYTSLSSYDSFNVTRASLKIAFKHKTTNYISGPSGGFYNNKADFEVVPCITFSAIAKDGESEKAASYTLGPNPLLRIISTDVTYNHFSSVKSGTSLSDLYNGAPYVHSFQYSVDTTTQWYKWSTSNKVSILAKDVIAQNTDTNWYLVKWTAFKDFTTALGVKVCDSDYCIRFIKMNGSTDYEINIEVLKKDDVNTYHIGNFGVYKIIDSAVITLLNSKFSTTGTVEYDDDIAYMIALPHCACVFEDTTRFKDLYIDIKGGTSYKNKGVLYASVFIPDPKYFCFGYYEFKDGFNPTSVYEPYNHPEKEAILNSYLRNQTIKCNAPK